MKLNAHVLEFSCPNCNRKIPETIGRLRNNPTLECQCGATIKIKADELRSGIARTKMALDDLQKTLSTLFK